MDLQSILFTVQQFINQYGPSGMVGPINFDKETLFTVGYAFYLYVMMDRFNFASTRRRKR